MKIMYEDNHILVVYKEAGILSQGDGSTTPDMLTLLKNYIKEKYQKLGNVYLGLVHRLDKETSGVMVFARTSKAARRLSEQMRNHQIEKWYLAVCKGKTDQGLMEDYFTKEEYKSRITTKEKGKLAKLSYQTLAYKEKESLVKVKLQTGRKHQIRLQFSSRNHAILGDQKYDKRGKYPLALSCYHLGFYHPITKEKVIFEHKPSYGYFLKFVDEIKKI